MEAKVITAAIEKAKVDITSSLTFLGHVTTQVIRPRQTFFTEDRLHTLIN